MDVALRPMTDEEFADWRAESLLNYAQQFVDSGSLTAVDAEKRVAADMERLLPDGPATTHHDLWTAVDGGEPVGVMWLFTEDRAGGPESFIYELAVHEDKRRRGYGRAIMLAVLDTCRKRGVVAVGLNVFGHNQPARALYDSLGFSVVSTSMKLTL